MTPQRMMMLVIGGIFIIASGWYMGGCPGVSVCPFFRKPTDPPKKVTLTFIGPFDDPDAWADVEEAFNLYKSQKENGYLDVRIAFEKIEDNIYYEEIVKQRQYDEKGPNIFLVFHNWIPRWEGKILPAPANVTTLQEFKNTYAKAAVEDLTQENGIIFALPFYIDTLALYYNVDMFLNEGLVEGPKNWIDFENYVERLTYFKKDKNGQVILDGKGKPVIENAGAAFGGGNNVNRSQDILMALVMQNNYDEKNIVTFKTQNTKNAIKFYVDFTNPDSRFYTWNKDQMFSIDAFTQRKAAMMINYGAQIENVNNKTGGTLEYKVSPFPQLDDRKKINYASYWVPVVASKAPCIAEPGAKVDCGKLAWEFLKFAAQKKYVTTYLDKTNRAAANLEIAKDQSLAQDTRSIFASQVFTARSWRNEADTISDEKLLDMINKLIDSGTSAVKIKEAIVTPMRYITEINK